MVVKRAVQASLFLLLSLRPAPAQAPVTPGPETVRAFIDRLQTTLRGGDREAYLGLFAPELREAESARVATYFDDLGMTGVKLRTAGARTAEDGSARAFVQAFYENATGAIIEFWSLSLARQGASWSVTGLDVPGSPTRLYKVAIPAERAEKARRVEVVHTDIRITFEDAAVFYDNIPDLETARIIVGRGKVVFTPSDANEKHQMDLLYKRDRLEEEIDSLYIRGSSDYFASNVRIEGAEGPSAVTAAERTKAAAVFARNYPRSFTIESSFDGGLLSFLPRNEEAVLEFRARRSGELAYVYFPFADEEISLYDHGHDRVISLYSPNPDAGQGLKRMFISFEEKFDVSSYALDLAYSPASSFLSAKASIEIVPRVDALDSLKFRFDPGLEILKITDAEERELFYTQDKLRKILYVYLLVPVAREAPTSIQVYYRGRIKPAAPTTDVIVQAGTSKVSTQPRYETYFFTHAGAWYPGPADEDYFRARLTVVVPPEYKCIANGELVAQGRREDLSDVAAIEKAGSAVYTFVSRSPVKYLSFIVGRFDRLKERPGPVPLSAQASSDILHSQPGLIDQAADILDFYVSSFGPFPYEKLAIVLRLWPDFGGHSPASFVVLNEVPWSGDSGFRLAGDTPVDLSTWDEYFLAHEIAHQWWGQGVSFGSYKDQWLSEGLAQFSAASYLGHQYGPTATAAILKKFARWTVRKSFRGPVLMGSRLSYQDFPAYQAIVYDKAALALFMLRDLIGEEAFSAGLRSFYARNKFQAPRTGEFIRAMEEASGRNLAAFFKGWFSSWELPEVRATWTETSVPEGVRIDLRVVQTKGVFVFPLWVEWTYAGTTRRTMIAVDEPTETLTWTLPGRPRRIRVDPDGALPGFIR
jgi:Peptidase family M1 domain